MGSDLYYEKNGISIYHGDCRDILPYLSDIDLIFTSPPYNLDVKSLASFQSKLGKWKVAKIAEGYDTYGDDMPYPEYVKWQKDCLRLMWESLSDRGAIYYNHKPRVVGFEVRLPIELNPDLPLRQEIIWARPGGLNYAPSHYVNTHERILLFAKEAFRLKSKPASGVGDVWKVAPDKESPHPAPFPLSLPAMAIETTPPGRVLDPFMGSGTTLLAARNAGLHAIGIDISERYCAMAVERLEQPSIYSGG